MRAKLITAVYMAQLWEEGAGVAVLDLDFNFVDASPEVFNGKLLVHLRRASVRLGVPLSSSSAPGALEELFRAVEKQAKNLQCSSTSTLDEGLRRVQELFTAGDLLGVWQQVEGLAV